MADQRVFKVGRQIQGVFRLKVQPVRHHTCGVFIILIVVCLLSVLWCVYYQYCYYRMCSLTRVTPYSWCVCLTCMSYMRSLQNVFSYWRMCSLAVFVLHACQIWYPVGNFSPLSRSPFLSSILSFSLFLSLSLSLSPALLPPSLFVFENLVCDDRMWFSSLLCVYRSLLQCHSCYRMCSLAIECVLLL